MGDLVFGESTLILSTSKNKEKKEMDTVSLRLQTI